MKIAVVSSGHIPSQWAHSINTVKHANAFAKLGHDVELLVVERYEEKRQRERIPDIYKWYGVDKIPISYFKDNPITYYNEHKILKSPVKFFNRVSGKKLIKWRDPEKRIIQYIKEKNFDLCYCRAYRAVEYAVNENLPVILETHSPEPSRSKELLALLKLSRLDAFKKIVTIHDILKKKYIVAGAPSEKILVLDDAVDLDLFTKENKSANLRKKLRLPENKHIVLYCGSLKPGKGILQILKTAAEMQQNKDVVFVVLGGSKKEVVKWRSVAAKSNLSNIQFKGFIEGALVPLYLKNADVLFMPFDLNEKKAVMDLESTSPIKLFEYMASEIPIVSANIPVISQVLKNKEEGELVSIEKEDYARAIELLLKDKQYSKKLAACAKNKVETYTYVNRCRKILQSISIK